MTRDFGQLGRKMTSYYNFRFLRRHYSANNILKFEYWMKFCIVGSYKYIISNWNRTLNKTRNLQPCHPTTLPPFPPCHLTTLLLFQNLLPYYPPTLPTFPDHYPPSFPSSPSSLSQINPFKITTKAFFLCPHWYKVHNIRILSQTHISPPRKWSRTAGFETGYANH